ncbi:MAG: DegT/DnrJ/EryC1/StrS family aminotransferase [Syntrophales bacterium]|nr:DegT/DnrJ/EryC1/StrS family aminotransferase [Syntrophales bacterium]
MVIPRHQPTYSFIDLISALQLCQHESPIVKLRETLSTLLGRRYVFLFNSGRVALYALLKAYNCPGKVIVPAYNCIVVPEAVIYAGYEPVFADINYGSLNMTEVTMENVLSKEVTAVLMTHQFGIPCNVDEIEKLGRRYGTLVVEDAAAALGAQVGDRPAGSLGDASILSFGNTKVLSAGSGGALLTDDPELAHRVQQLMPSESHQKYQIDLAFYFLTLAWKVAFSSALYPLVQKAYRFLKSDELFQVVSPKTRMPNNFLQPCSAFSAALCLLQLDRLEKIVERRNSLARIYADKLAGTSLGLPQVPRGMVPAWIQFPIVVNEKERFFDYMRNRGIDLSWTFRYACSESFGVTDCPKAQKAARTVLGMPTYPALTANNAYQIALAAQSFNSKN